MRRKSWLPLLLGGGLLLLTGCATLEVTPRKALEPATAKQPVTLGVLALGDRLQEVANDAATSPVRAGSGSLFASVSLLPKEARFKPASELQTTYGVDYLLTVAIDDIGVSGNLNPYWIASMPLLFFKIYAPIVTFEPGVSLDATLVDLRSGQLLMHKQVLETATDYYAPADPAPKVRKLISLTIGNALVGVMRDAQTAIAAARTGKP